MTGLIQEQELATKRALRLYAEIIQFLDHVLISTVQAHEASDRPATGCIASLRWETRDRPLGLDRSAQRKISGVREATDPGAGVDRASTGSA